jgi:phospholipid/cholesterol/gamma-HCH transport system substrate-binding protein
MRALFDYVPGAHRGRPLLLGAIAVATVAVILALGFTGWTPFGAGGQIVKARFDTAVHIFPATPVRVDGVDVGTVAGSRLVPGGGVELDLRITTGGVTVHRDASATLYWRTLLGRNVYVALNPGTTSSPALRDAAIPASRTSSQVELDQVIGALQPLARAGMRELFSELDQGLSGGGARAAIDRLAPGLAPTATAITAFRGQNPGVDIPVLTRGAQRAIAGLDSGEAALGGLIDSADQALRVTAANQADLGSIVSQAPATLHDTELTMARVDRTLRVLDPLAQRLVPGVQRIAPAVNAATPTMHLVSALVPSAVPALADLQPALHSLDAMSATGIPLIAGLSPTLDRTSSQIIPFLNQTSSTTRLRNYEAIGPFFSAVDSSASTFDGGGFMQRFQPGQRAGASTQIPPSECSNLHLSSSPALLQGCQSLVSAINGTLIGGVPTNALTRRSAR